jgi:hypothetical protein
VAGFVIRHEVKNNTQQHQWVPPSVVAGRAKPPELKLRGDIMEGRTEVGADQLEGGDCGNRYQGSDQPVFNRGRPILVFP